MFAAQNAEIKKDQQLSDFYLNKILPVSQFTQTCNILREFSDDKSQLERIKTLQDNFFEGLIKQSKSGKQELQDMLIKHQGTGFFSATSQIDSLTIENQQSP